MDEGSVTSQSYASSGDFDPEESGDSLGEDDLDDDVIIPTKRRLESVQSKSNEKVMGMR